MANNREGGVKTRDKLLAKNPNYYRDIGAIGGRACVSKGFGTNPELAREAGYKGWLKRLENMRSKNED